MSVSYWTLPLSLKSYTCTSICSALQSFWAAVNAVKLLNLHILEQLVNYMTILTASLETSVEQYQSRKLKWIYDYPFGRDIDQTNFWTTEFINSKVSYFMLSNYRGEKKGTRCNILQMQLTTGITKSTRKSVKLLTILVAFSSHFMKWGTCLFVL